MIARILEAFPELNRDWLLTGEGSMLKGDSDVTLLGNVQKANETDTVDVRFFEVTPTASFREFCEGINEESQTVSIVPPAGEHISESDCVFEIYGESMAPQINNKARVLCREIPASKWHNIPNGQIIVIAYADKFVIKRIGINALGEANYLTLQSDNPDYPQVETVQRADIRTIFTARFILSSKIH